MRLFYLVLVFIFFGSTTVHADIATKEACEHWRKESRELTRQMPIRLDFATSWTGAEAVYFNDRCHVNHILYINDGRFFEGEARLIDASSHEEALKLVREFALSDEGYHVIKKLMLEDALPIAKKMIRDVDNVTLVRRYVTEGTIKPFTIEITSEMLRDIYD